MGSYLLHVCHVLPHHGPNPTGAPHHLGPAQQEKQGHWVLPRKSVSYKPKSSWTTGAMSIRVLSFCWLVLLRKQQIVCQEPRGLPSCKVEKCGLKFLKQNVGVPKFVLCICLVPIICS